MSLELLKQSTTWILSGLIAMIWSVLANLLTPLLIRKYKNRKNNRHRHIVEARKQVNKAIEQRDEIIALQKSPSLRTEQKLGAIHKQLTGISLYLVSFVTMWLSSIAEPFFLLVAGSVFIFIQGNNQIDRGGKQFYRANLAYKRSKELKVYKTKSEEEKAEKTSEMNIRDFGIE